MPLRPKKASEDEVRKCWGLLSPDQRCQRMTFHDPKLVERIESTVQEMFVSYVLMTAGRNPDVLSTATFFTSAFEFTWDEVRLQPILAMKPAFAAKDDDMFNSVRAVLPDLFCSSRSVVHRARWKELWNTKPTSVVALEQAIAKLMEQAFWALAADPGCPESCVDPLPAILSEGWDSDSGVQCSTPQRKTPTKKSTKARKKLAQDQKSRVKESFGREDQEHQADHAEGERKCDTVRAQEFAQVVSRHPRLPETPDIFDDGCSTCSGSSFLYPQSASAESTPNSCFSSHAAPPLLSLQGATSPAEQELVYVWAESGQWLRQCVAHRSAYRGPRAVVNNTFLDLDECAQPSDCRRAQSLPPRFDAPVSDE